MPAIHRNGDPRACGATTIVSGQSTVFANEKLVAINGNLSTHGGATLNAGSKNVFIAGVAVVKNTADTASPCSVPHSNTQTAGGSPDVNVGDP